MTMGDNVENKGTLGVTDSLSAPRDTPACLPVFRVFLVQPANFRASASRRTSFLSVNVNSPISLMVNGPSPVISATASSIIESLRLCISPCSA